MATKDYIIETLKKQLKEADLDAKEERVGTVLEVSDGIVRIAGLSQAMSSEMLEFPDLDGPLLASLPADQFPVGQCDPTDGKVKSRRSLKAHRASGEPISGLSRVGVPGVDPRGQSDVLPGDQLTRPALHLELEFHLDFVALDERLFEAGVGQGRAAGDDAEGSRGAPGRRGFRARAR